MGSFPLFPEQASTIAGQTDALYYFLIAVSVFFLLLIAGLVIYFAVRYRRRSEVEPAPEPAAVVAATALLTEEGVSVALVGYWIPRSWIALRDDVPEPYIDRALAKKGLNRYREAVDDFSAALQHHTSITRVYFMRARARDQAGDHEGARRDMAEGMRLGRAHAGHDGARKAHQDRR